MQEQYLTFNILGKIFSVNERLFQTNSSLFYGTLFTDRNRLKQFYDEQRQQYVIDMSPLIFENILRFYASEELHAPTNVQIDFYRETLEKFHIDTSSFDVDERFDRYVSRQSTMQVIHVLLEYADCKIFTIHDSQKVDVTMIVIDRVKEIEDFLSS
jgi:hypothetical protein